MNRLDGNFTLYLNLDFLHIGVCIRHGMGMAWLFCMYVDPHSLFRFMPFGEKNI